jgi:hypothetical protein
VHDRVLEEREGGGGWRSTLEAHYMGTRYSTEALSLDGELLFFGAGLAYRFE